MRKQAGTHLIPCDNEPTTKREKQIIYAIVDFTLRNGYPPSHREIGDITGLKSTSNVHHYVQKLIERGYLTQRDGTSRTILVTPKGHVAIKALTEMPKVDPKEEWEKAMFRQKVIRNRVGGERGVT